MLKADLDSLISLVNTKSIAEENDYTRLWELYLREESAEERINCIREYSDAFWCICAKWNTGCSINDFTELIKNMKNFISFISANSSSQSGGIYESKSIAFINFLEWLMNRSKLYETSQIEKFKDFYRKLNDVIGNVKWIFELEIEDIKVFPIHRLIEDAVTDFELTEEHYLQLVFSLQLFNRIEDISEDEGNIKKRMIELSKEFHLEIIEMLCDNGQLLYGENAGINSAHNGTIVVIQGNKILIRNVNSEYFEGDCSFEGDGEENAIAYYITYNKQDYEKVTSFEEIIKSDNYQSKLTLFKDLLQNKIYNIFLGEVFLVDERNNSYTQVVNKYGKNDDYIISNGRVFRGEKTLFETFWKRIESDQNGIRVCPIAKSGSLNVLTLDFMSIFCKTLCNNETNYFDELLDFKDDSYYQNQLFEKYINISLKKGHILDAIRKYGIFVNDYLNVEMVSDDTTFSEMPHIILPYSIYVPFDGDKDKLFSELLAEKYIDEDVIVETLIVNKKIGNRVEFKVGNSVIEAEKIYNLSGINIDTTAISNSICFYAQGKNCVYLLGEYSDVIDTINNLLKVSKNYMIDENWLPKLKTKFDNLIKILTNIGFEQKTYAMLGARGNDPFTSSIALYKFLWLMQVFQFDLDKYTEFEQIILEGFYCKFALEPEKMMREYLNKIEDEKNANALIIAKETDGSGATLNLLVRRYSNGERGALMMAFDGGSINSNIELKGNNYYYMGQPLKKIVFLTDNALSGKSTVDMLNFYLKNKITPGDKRHYIFEQKNNKVPDILKKNPKIEIEVRTVFYSERAEEKIMHDFSKLNIKVSGDKIAKNKYNWTSKINDTIHNLFDVGKKPINSKVQCVLRPCNMPYDLILPDFLKDSPKLVSVFRHKED